MQINNWMAQQGAGNNVAEDVGENVAAQEDIEIHPQWGEWPAPPPPAPPVLYNYQEWLANEGLQVQDGILPANNLQDSPFAAWNDSISLSSSSTNSDSDALVLVPASVLQVLQRNGALHSAVVAPPVVNNELMAPTSDAQVPRIQIHVSVTNAGMNIQFQADNEFLNGLLIAEPLSYVPITNFLSSSIMPSLATIGPWAHGYGMRPTKLDITLSLSEYNGAVQVSSYITQGEEDGSVTTTINVWSLASEVMQILSDDTQDMGFSAGDQAMEISETPTDQEVLQMDISEIQAGSSRVGSSNKHGKNKAPLSVTSVRRSARSNKDDGFKVPPLTDSRTKISKVKPRVIPNAVSAVVISEISDDQPAHGELPPPMTIEQIQHIAVHQCAVPPEEITEDLLMADMGAGSSSTSS